MKDVTIKIQTSPKNNQVVFVFVVENKIIKTSELYMLDEDTIQLLKGLLSGVYNFIEETDTKRKVQISNFINSIEKGDIPQ